LSEEGLRGRGNVILGRDENMQEKEKGRVMLEKVADFS